MIEVEDRVAALGRPVFLGQLYNAHTGELLNDTLLPTKVVKANTADKGYGNTKISYELLESQQSRMELLDVKASISVSVMSGALKISGAASYLDRSETSESSITLGSSIHQRHRVIGLNVSDQAVRQSSILQPQRLKKLRATHVVSSLEIGGSLVASLTEFNSAANNEDKVEAKGKIETMKTLKALGGASGEASLDMKEKEKMSRYELELRLVGDYLEGPVPVTVAGLTDRIRHANSLLGTPVPLKFGLVPITHFHATSTELMYRELEEDALAELAAIYDSLIVLTKERTAFVDQVDKVYGEYFPSFRQACQDRAQALDLLVVQSRGELGAFFQNYGRDGAQEDETATGSTMSALLTKVQGEYATETALLEEDREQWATLTGLITHAETCQFPCKKPSEIVAMLSSADRPPVGLVIIPVGVHITALSNFLSDLAKHVVDWYNSRSGRDSTELQSQPMLCSVYADPLMEKGLVLLDDTHQTLVQSLNRAREMSVAVFVSCGISQNNLGLVRWTGSSGQLRGWGTITGKDGLWKYVGELRNSQPHGYGVKSIGDGTQQRGTWFDGVMDGYGSITKDDQYVDNGTFVDGRPEKQNSRTVIVKAIRNFTVVDTVTFAVLCSPTVDHDNLSLDYTSYAQSIQEKMPKQVDKVARAFGWTTERFRLRSVYQEQHTISPYPGSEAAEKLYVGFRWYSSDISVIAQGRNVVEIDPGWRKDMAESLKREPWLDCAELGDGRISPIGGGHSPSERQYMEAILLD